MCYVLSLQHSNYIDKVQINNYLKVNVTEDSKEGWITDQ